MDGVEAVVNDILYGIGEMLPAVAVEHRNRRRRRSGCGGQRGLVAYDGGDLLRLDLFTGPAGGEGGGEAASYALLTAASEAALQYGFSGVKALGGSALSRTLGKKTRWGAGEAGLGKSGTAVCGMVLKNIRAERRGVCGGIPAKRDDAFPAQRGLWGKQ